MAGASTSTSSRTCAHRANISLRSGCFCNPGASEAAHGLRPDDLRTWFDRHEPVHPEDLHDADGHRVAALRASLGVASNFADVHRLVRFVVEVAGHRR